MREHYIGMEYDLCMHWLGVDQCVFRPFQDQLLVGHSEGVSRYVFAGVEDFLVWLFLVLVKPTWIRWKSIFITHSTPSREERISFRSFSINCQQIPSSWIPILYSNVRISILCSSFFVFVLFLLCNILCVKGIQSPFTDLFARFVLSNFFFLIFIQNRYFRRHCQSAESCTGDTNHEESKRRKTRRINRISGIRIQRVSSINQRPLLCHKDRAAHLLSPKYGCWCMKMNNCWYKDSSIE